MNSRFLSRMIDIPIVSLAMRLPTTAPLAPEPSVLAEKPGKREKKRREERRGEERKRKGEKRGVKIKKVKLKIEGSYFF